jgi:Tfp pilus assembly protein PilF
MAITALCVIGAFLFTACSQWKKMTSRLPFRGDDQSEYSLTEKDIEKFTHTLKLTDTNAESHYRLACFYQERKKHRLAIEEFKKALQNNPAEVKAYNGIGVSYDLLGEFPRAVKAYEAALRLDPKLAYVYNNLGYSYLLQQKFDSAINAFHQAVALDQENSQYHNNLALAYGKKGNYDLAFNEFKRAGNEEKARCHMAQLFNQKPGMYSTETLVAANLPQNDNQDAVKEKPAHTALLDQDLREETLGVSSTKNLSPQNTNQPTEAQRIVISQNIEMLDKSSYPDKKDTTSVDVLTEVKIFPEAGEGIEISNGNGIRNFARNVGFYLTQRGFQVASLRDEPSFTVKKTTIFYCEGYLQDAYHVAKEIPQYQEMVKVKRFANPNIKIRVVVGHDMLSYHKPLFLNAEPLRSL